MVTGTSSSGRHPTAITCSETPESLGPRRACVPPGAILGPVVPRCHRSKSGRWRSATTEPWSAVGAVSPPTASGSPRGPGGGSRRACERRAADAPRRFAPRCRDQRRSPCSVRRARPSSQRRSLSGSRSAQDGGGKRAWRRQGGGPFHFEWARLGHVRSRTSAPQRAGARAAMPLRSPSSSHQRVTASNP